MYRALLLALALLAGTAFAETAPDEYGEVEAAPPELKGVGRFSIQTGWRMSPNETFYGNYYGEHPELARAPKSPGGPLLVGSFAYSFTNIVELSLDLVATGERLRLTEQPTLSTLTLSALVGLRFQKLLPGIGPQGLVPFVGVLAGPTFLMSHFEGNANYQEASTTAFAATVGATLRLSSRWGITAEYRLANAHGWPGFVKQPDLHLQDFGNFNAGGHWLSLGFAYWWAPKPRPGGEGFSGW